MVTAKLVIAFFAAPGNAKRSDQCSRICLVLMCQQKVDAALKQPVIVRVWRQRKPFGGSLPLVGECLAHLLERDAQRLPKSAQRIVLSRTECQTYREFRAPRKIEAAGQGNVAVERSIVLPVQVIVISQVGPAVIHANITARRFRKWNVGPDHKPGIPVMCSQKFVV